MMYQFFLALLMTLFLNDPAQGSAATSAEETTDRTEAVGKPPYIPGTNLLLVKNQLTDDVVIGGQASRQVITIPAGSHKWFTISMRNAFDVIIISYAVVRSASLFDCPHTPIVAHAIFGDYALPGCVQERIYESRKAFVTERLVPTDTEQYIGTITLSIEDPRIERK